MDKKLGKLVAGQDTACAALVAALEYMPLAIVQATSYLLQRAQRCSVSQYLEKFRRNDRKRAGLLDFEGGQLRRDPGAKNSIILTWQISFDYIRNMRPSAADLLSLMCFCDRQGIPESLLRGLGNDNEDDSDNEDDNRSNEYDGSASEFQQQSHIKDKQSDDETCADCETSTSDCHSTSSSSSGDAFEADISILRSYSFITINTYGTAFEMHSLVQLAMRKWLQEQGQQERWKQDLIHCVCAEAPNGQYENWITWQKLLPHAQSAILYRPKNNEKSLKQWGTVLYRMAWYLLEIGRVVEALEVAEEVMKARIKLFGPTHEDSLWAMAIVSDIQCHLGTWEEAEKLSVQVIEARKIKLGADHPHTLISMGSLASTYRGQGRWEEAEKLEVQVMEAHKIKLGADHPDTLTSMGNLAYTWQHMGDFVEAMALLRECIRYREVRLGLNHPSTQSSIATLSAWEGKREANDR
jgi:tetratricopeptide (TPR) repeat protein